MDNTEPVNSFREPIQVGKLMQELLLDPEARSADVRRGHR